jgi:hypothetical protein
MVVPDPAVACSAAWHVARHHQCCLLGIGWYKCVLSSPQGGSLIAAIQHAKVPGLGLESHQLGTVAGLTNSALGPNHGDAA